MVSLRSMIVLLLTTSFAASGSPLNQGNNVLPDNEKICLESVEALLGQQQILFSDRHADPEVRRHAERTIDASRDAYARHGSYCDAQKALQAHSQESDTRSKPGEISVFRSQQS
ncbi:hypothetical protein [Photobacterium ganghwense]|uniref:hypothetical protein n=1 Tax=Photobacterium ganghwense TaxID=320778 RepID=UPI000A8DD0A8|nr:hypothetical protein [Photobacterium ganghwense]QSV16701.1 hypothetical protein FH974_17150 [Photobacterium ganghwense]